MSLIPWFQLLHDYFRLDLAPDEKERWPREISEDLDGVTQDELCEAIRFAVKNRKKGTYDGKPDVEQLEIWVKWYRKQRAIDRSGAWSVKTEQGFLNMLKARMREAPDNLKRWDILSDPMRACGAPRDCTLLECAQLEDWARGEWPEFEADVKAMKARWDEETKGRFSEVAVIGCEPSEDADDSLPF